ncbi:hypothetical protein V500_07551 [Pseudogymnoascus sp. VKM F-4518 (FW-2643)]|nr:hypothetical protein V500_07551 [Pseudogymnoascus sp. VKM F-4518 (FW-2643)]
MPSISNAVGTPFQQSPTRLLAKIIYLLLVFTKDGINLFIAVNLLIAVSVSILYCFQYFGQLRPQNLGPVTPQRPPYPSTTSPTMIHPYLSNEHQTIAPNNFYNYNAQAGHAAPLNDLLVQFSLGGEPAPTASGKVAASTSSGHLLSVSGTKKGSFIVRSTPRRGRGA